MPKEDALPCSCEVDPKAKRDDSKFVRDVKVANSWSTKAQLTKDIEKQLDDTKSWPTDLPASAVALSKGGAVAASTSVVARAKINDEWIGSTELLKASARGKSTVTASIKNKGDESQVSAAVLVLMEAIADIDEQVTEIVKTSNVSSTIVSYLHPTVGEVLDVALGVFSSGDVSVKARGSMKYDISPSDGASGEIKAHAGVRLKFSGTTISEPSDDEFGKSHCVAGLASGSATTSITAKVESTAAVEGSASGSWYGEAGVTSLWACTWASCCKGKVLKEERASQKGDESRRGDDSQEDCVDSAYGFEFEFQTRLPPHDGTESSKDLIARLVKWLENKLNTLMDGHFKPEKDAMPPACDDPDKVQEKLRTVLLEWYDAIVDEFGFFADADFDGGED